MKKIIALAIVAACSQPIFAQSVGSVYGEAAYGMVTLKDTSSDDLGTYKPTVARLTLGTVVIDNLAVEGFLMQGLSSDSKTLADGTKIVIKTSSGYGIALRPFVKATEELELYARIGTSRNKLKWSADSDSGADTATQTLYGLGAAYKFDKNWSAVVDYTKFTKKLESEVSILAVGLRYNF